MKYVAIIAFIGIFAALGSALVFMMKGNRGGAAPSGDDAEHNIARGKKMATALGFRVAISVGLFLLVLALYFAGVIQPGGVPVGK
jgi:hypothetical protein